MKSYRFIDDTEVFHAGATRRFSRGVVRALPEDVAAPLVADGKAERVAVKAAAKKPAAKKAPAKKSAAQRRPRAKRA